MRILFVAGDTPEAVLPLVAAARAALVAGHEVVLAGAADLGGAAEAAAGAGIATAAVTARTPAEAFLDTGGNPFPVPEDPHEGRVLRGRCLGRFAAWCLAGLPGLADRLRPDAVVGVSSAFAGPLVAAHAKVPYVLFTAAPGEPLAVALAAAAELTPQLEGLGLYALPDPDLSADTPEALVAALARLG
ncbi:hypothetical protein V7793_22520 [Streptomyces sp. KLMMK]|uniref:hypothetical protein n=1 Tax=Streptomyces sp. KLMMK TaxID=3109353 RepID=UPI0030098581